MFSGDQTLAHHLDSFGLLQTKYTIDTLEVLTKHPHLMFLLMFVNFRRSYSFREKKRTTALTSSFGQSLTGLAILESVVFNSAFTNGAETVHRER
ncbi:hypothetical protein ElyMa_005717300 [Elysia marginata]|uniref:Uncharacterized protein n=1 Tax=Elysia marginata TaxID=1093978 RepID=A0AAV4FHI5_9GAST|nr:hypothetical protein ElyMa_005717300 [Elysia marginata]